MYIHSCSRLHTTNSHNDICSNKLSFYSLSGRRKCHSHMAARGVQENRTDERVNRRIRWNKWIRNGRHAMRCVLELKATRMRYAHAYNRIQSALPRPSPRPSPPTSSPPRTSCLNGRRWRVEWAHHTQEGAALHAAYACMCYALDCVCLCTRACACVCLVCTPRNVQNSLGND